MPGNKHVYFSKDKTKALPIIILLIVGALGISGVMLMVNSGKSDVDVIASTLSFLSKKVSLTLVSEKETLKVGDTAEVSIVLNPYKKAIQTVDVVVHFDPAMVRVEPFDPTSSDKIARSINISNTSFKDYSNVVLDNQRGTVSFTATIEPSNIAKGSGKIAGIKIKAMKAGAAKLSMKVDTGDKKESRVLSDTGKNILEFVKSDQLTITQK